MFMGNYAAQLEYCPYLLTDVVVVSSRYICQTSRARGCGKTKTLRAKGKPKPPPRQNKVVRAARRIKLDRVQIVGSLARPMKTGARSVEAGLI